VRQKDSDIAAQIARQAGLTAQTTDSQIVHDYVIQSGQTDMEFLLERAYRIGYEVLVENKTLIFRPIANTQSPILTLNLDQDLLEFYPRLSMAEQVSEAIVRGWNVKEKTVIVGRASPSDIQGTMGGQTTGAAIIKSKFGTTVGLSQHQPVMSQAEADRLARSKLDRSTLKLITGEGICWGRTDLRPGKVIKIDGIGKRFSGHYYVTTAIHRYTSSDGYQTRFTVRRNAS
jgi:phage protein D